MTEVQQTPKEPVQVTEKKQKEEDKTYWCSWCFHNVEQELVRHSAIKRDIFRCTHCYHLTQHCLKCHLGMSKMFEGSSDMLCASCSGGIKAWTDSTDGKTHEIPDKWILNDKWCSWCFMKDKHILLQKRTIKKNLYQCQNCAKQTCKCKKCNEAMARESTNICAHCDKTIKDWESAQQQEESKAWQREAWCSWCFEKTTHSMEAKHYVKRTAFTCSGCSLKTVPCKNCQIGMARGGMTWDDSVCSACSKDFDTKMTWEQIKEKKDAIINKPRSTETVEEELKRESKYKEEARKKGLLRPFMLLVAMPPIFRNQAACFLGWTIITEDYFGDAHAESWHILFKANKGMRTRCHKSYEKVNPLGKGCNWLDILSRVAESAFKKDINKEDKLSSKEVKEHLNNSSDRYILDKEEQFLIELGKLVKSQMTEKQREEMEQEEQSGDDEAKRLFLQNSGVTTKEAASYGFRLVNKVFNLTGNVGTIMVKQSAPLLASIGGTSSVIGMGTTIAAPLTAQLALLGTPLFFLSILGLAKTGFSMIFGSTEGRLFVPVVLILNQRLLLAAENLKIENYY